MSHRKRFIRRPTRLVGPGAYGLLYPGAVYLRCHNAYLEIWKKGVHTIKSWYYALHSLCPYNGDLWSPTEDDLLQTLHRSGLTPMLRY